MMRDLVEENDQGCAPENGFCTAQAKVRQQRPLLWQRREPVRNATLAMSGLEQSVAHQPLSPAKPVKTGEDLWISQ